MMDWANLCGGSMLVMIVWLILLIIITIAFVRWMFTNSKKDTALQILREQYARGGINQKEFEERKNNLTK